MKKVSKVDSQKKPATSQKGTRNAEKGDLGDKINKKLESLNIKTVGKKVESKPVKAPKEIVPVAKGKKVEKIGSAGEIA